MKVGIFGPGAYGSSLAEALVYNNNEVMMWTPFEEERAYIEKTRLIKSLPGVKINDKIKITTDLDEILSFSKLLIVAIPAKTVDGLFSKIGNKIDDKYICIASKGIEEETGLFIHEVIGKYTNNQNIAILSGPSFAIDLINKTKCGLSLAVNNDETATIFEQALENDYLKVRVNHDIIGTEICGAIKNVIAIASGMIDGLNSSESTKAMLLTEALHDMEKIIIEFGGSERTILSYAGFGDLILTASSTKSRNYCFGKLIGQNSTKEEIQEYLKENTVEGYNTLLSIYKLLREKKIKIPMINLIYQIIVQGKPAEEILKFLIEKD